MMVFGYFVPQRLLTAIGIVLALVLLGGGWFLLRGESKPTPPNAPGVARGPLGLNEGVQIRGTLVLHSCQDKQRKNCRFGAPPPATPLILINAQGRKRQTATQAGGVFVIKLPPGRYRLQTQIKKAKIEQVLTISAQDPFPRVVVAAKS